MRGICGTRKQHFFWMQFPNRTLLDDSSKKVRAAPIGVDVGTAGNSQFLQTIDDEGGQSVADVHKDQSIYLEDPRPYP